MRKGQKNSLIGNIKALLANISADADVGEALTAAGLEIGLFARGQAYLDQYLSAATDTKRALKDQMLATRRKNRIKAEVSLKMNDLKVMVRTNYPRDSPMRRGLGLTPRYQTQVSTDEHPGDAEPVARRLPERRSLQETSLIGEWRLLVGNASQVEGEDARIFADFGFDPDALSEIEGKIDHLETLIGARKGSAKAYQKRIEERRLAWNRLLAWYRPVNHRLKTAMAMVPGGLGAILLRMLGANGRGVAALPAAVPGDGGHHAGPGSGMGGGGTSNSGEDLRPGQTGDGTLMPDPGDADPASGNRPAHDRGGPGDGL